MKQRETIHTLTWSLKGDHYTLDRTVGGKALAEGDRVAIEVAHDTWITGTITRSRNVQISTDRGLQQGFNFVSDEGVIIGLCSGMRVCIASM